jgi:hypothetical protein
MSHRLKWTGRQRNMLLTDIFHSKGDGSVIKLQTTLIYRDGCRTEQARRSIVALGIDSPDPESAQGTCTSLILEMHRDKDWGAFERMMTSPIGANILEIKCSLPKSHEGREDTHER